jgi:soluble lytic murein transglycosylase-like protein
MKSFEILSAVQRGVRAFAVDVAKGFFEVIHNGLALVGVLVLLVAALLFTRPDLREQGEQHLAAWLTVRQAALLGLTPEPTAVKRATAVNPKALPREQANVALWLARKYHVAPEPMAAVVAEAYEAGQSSDIDPTLVLAVMAVESSFNPFAQSTVGAQGLMQVMTHVHSEKYKYFGGQYAAFDPRTNVRVGVKILNDSITRAGSVPAGLRDYVGAANLRTDGGYADRVLAEYMRLQQVAKGNLIPVTDGRTSAHSSAVPVKSANPVDSAAATKAIDSVALPPVAPSVVPLPSEPVPNAALEMAALPS